MTNELLGLTTIDRYAAIGILIAITAALAVAMVLISHFVGRHRAGPVKDTPYESGMPVIGDARRRFNIKFYLVAMMFLLFDVEVVLFWPWAVVFHKAATRPDHPVSQALERSFVDPPSFLLWAGAVFFALLLVGFLYDLGKGIFRWS